MAVWNLLWVGIETRFGQWGNAMDIPMKLGGLVARAPGACGGASPGVKEAERRQQGLSDLAGPRQESRQGRS